MGYRQSGRKIRHIFRLICDCKRSPYCRSNRRPVQSEKPQKLCQKYYNQKRWQCVHGTDCRSQKSHNKCREYFTADSKRQIRNDNRKHGVHNQRKQRSEAFSNHNRNTVRQPDCQLLLHHKPCHFHTQNCGHHTGKKTGCTQIRNIQSAFYSQSA